MLAHKPLTYTIYIPIYGSRYDDEIAKFHLRREKNK